MSMVLSQKTDIIAEKNKIEQSKIDAENRRKEEHLQVSLEIVKEKNRIKEKRVEEEFIAKKAELEFEVKKFEHQKDLEVRAMDIKKADIDFKKAELESKEKLAILEMEKQERLEMFKLNGVRTIKKEKCIDGCTVFRLNNLQFKM